MKKGIWILIAFISTTTFAQKAEDLKKFGKLITQEGLKEKLTVIASAEMEGRETATPGQKKAAAFIESQFKKWGLQPGNGESYQQVYPVYQDALTEKSLTVNGKAYEWDKDYSFSLQTISSGNFNYTNVVYAGYGIVDAANGINDYENLDVQGKLVIVSEGSAAGTPSMGQGGNRAFNANPASPMAKMRNAMTKGAAGLCIISADFPKKMATPTKGNMYTKANTAKGFAMLSVSKEVANAILGTSNYTKGAVATQINLVATKSTDNLESSNVVGVIPGTDKKRNT